MLYDHISQRIIVSRDVVFEEDKYWDWDKSQNEELMSTWIGFTVTIKKLQLTTQKEMR